MSQEDQRVASWEGEKRKKGAGGGGGGGGGVGSWKVGKGGRIVS